MMRLVIPLTPRVIATTAALVVAAVLMLALWVRRDDGDVDPLASATSEDLDADADDPRLVELEPPLRRSQTLIGTIKSVWNYRKQLSALRDKGYVKWYLVDAGWPRPKYVRPKLNNGGVPEVEYNGDWYLFPEDSLVPDSESGLWTAIHRTGDAKPVDPRDPATETLDADTLADYATRRPAASKPSLLSKFDLGELDPLKVALYGTIAIAIAWQVLG